MEPGVPDKAITPGATPSEAPGQPTRATPRRRRGQLLECGWCGTQIAVARVGRTPKWCSDTCRHRAWETRRALATGAVPVRLVDRTIEVERLVPTVQQVEVLALPKGSAWAPALQELAKQLDMGRVYDRDLGVVADGVTVVFDALSRRLALSRRS